MTHDQSQIDAIDPRGLIRDSYRIDGIDAGQCRSVFLDWVLGASDTPEQSIQIQALVDFYTPQNPTHPMSEVLLQGMAGQAVAKGRRGGWRSRQR